MKDVVREKMQELLGLYFKMFISHLKCVSLCVVPDDAVTVVHSNSGRGAQQPEASKSSSQRDARGLPQKHTVN